MIAALPRLAEVHSERTQKAMAEEHATTELDPRGYVYFVEGDSGRAIKIGHTKLPGRRRLEIANQAKILFHTPRIVFLAVIPGTFEDEQALHLRFEKYAIGGSEWYHSCSEVRQYIDSLGPFLAPRDVWARHTFQPRKQSQFNPLEGGLSSSEVAAVTGATLRQLQWWDETGIVVAERNQFGRRVYRESQIPLILVTAALAKHPGTGPRTACGMAKMLLTQFQVTPKTSQTQNVSQA